MPVMLERWNDDKMDGLAAKVDVLAVKVDGIEGQLREQQRELHELRQDTKAGFERIEDRFERMQRTMIHAAVGLSGSILLAFATLVATAGL